MLWKPYELKILKSNLTIDEMCDELPHRTRKRSRDKNFKKIVQGEWTLGHSDEELRENVFVGDVALKDVPEEQLAVIWNEKIGTHHFRQAVRREVVHRVSNYFKTGYEKVEKLNTKSPVASVFEQNKQKDHIDEILEKAKCLK
jgi:hypothetical protein